MGMLMVITVIMIIIHHFSRAASGFQTFHRLSSRQGRDSEHQVDRVETLATPSLGHEGITLGRARAILLLYVL